ncbi:MAG: hypothetical protein OXF74_02585 [Rhodobacteraceae bacterium]|nr:hypothetical protein [Paracoccaceae bacterium]
MTLTGCGKRQSRTRCRTLLLLSAVVVTGAAASEARAHDGRCLTELAEVFELFERYMDVRAELFEATEALGAALFAGVGRDILEVDLELVNAASDRLKIAEARESEAILTWFERLHDAATGPCSM